jgi:hypothetical protein
VLPESWTPRRFPVNARRSGILGSNGEDTSTLRLAGLPFRCSGSGAWRLLRRRQRAGSSPPPEPLCRSPSAWAGRSLHPASADLGRDHQAAAIPAARHPQLLPPGPVEWILIEFDVASTSDLDQAAAIDRAADKVILRATARSRPSEPNRDRGGSAGSPGLVERALGTCSCRVTSASRARQPSLQAEAEAGA